MNAQEEILRACHHDPKVEVDMGHGEVVWSCSDCYNHSVYVRRAERKHQLAVYWNRYAAEQMTVMREADAHVGQRVQYFAASMLGIGGVLLTGKIILNRNNVAVVRLDRKWDGHRETQWSKAWKAV